MAHMSENGEQSVIETRQVAGKRIFDALKTWYQGYLYLPDTRTATMLALWSVGTHLMQRMQSYPYLAICGTRPGCGKTRVLELLQAVCKSAELGTSLRPSYLLAMLHGSGGEATVLWDEAETTRGVGQTFLGELLNAGYRAGQTIGRVAGSKVTKYHVFSAKAFALIGQPSPVLASRSLIVRMSPGPVARQYQWATAHEEGAELARAIETFLAKWGTRDYDVLTDAAWTVGRDQEITSPILGLAQWLTGDEAVIADVRAWLADMIEFRDAAPVVAQVADATLDREAGYAETLAADIRAIAAETGKPWLTTADLLAALRAKATSPWRAYKGVGLDAIRLAQLMTLFGVTPTQKKIREAGKVQVLRGYSLTGELALPQAGETDAQSFGSQD